MVTDEGASPENTGPAPEITLRPFQLSDVDYLLEWMGDDSVNRYISLESLTTREQALDYLKNTVLPHPCYRAICVDGRPAGCVSARMKTGKYRCRATIAGVLARQYWRRGIASAALRMMVAEAFSLFPELERVDLLIALKNVSAQRLMESMGFVRECVHRRFVVGKGRTWDVVRYSMLRASPKL